MSGWSCPNAFNEHCNLLNVPCEPGIKGCVLYGMVTFSNPENPSNKAYEKRQERAREDEKPASKKR